MRVRPSSYALPRRTGRLVGAMMESVSVEAKPAFGSQADQGPGGTLEAAFDAAFVTRLAMREKQVQQNYRPVIGIHKWFARRPGTVFRSLLLSEFAGDEPLSSSFFSPHRLHGVVADPFMGGGTPTFEANRLGLHTIGTDVNPMAFWIVRQSLADLDLSAFAAEAQSAVADVEQVIGDLYRTRCLECGRWATVKYFVWVKVSACPACGAANDLFPGYLLAEAERHPRPVLACPACGDLNEYETIPTLATPAACKRCSSDVHVEGNVRHGSLRCWQCQRKFSVGSGDAQEPFRHRLWALEYHCDTCKSGHQGRFFKAPDAGDLERADRAAKLLADARDLPIPDDDIPPGDESDRLHRWGYSKYRQMFSDRQLFGLGTLLRRLMQVRDAAVRHALLTVFSDFLRYQNMLCRYDTYALKCQDIFSVHGFPVALVQCENNLLGIPRVGSGSYRHFIEKYRRAKEYCRQPFETRHVAGRKKLVPIPGERIAAALVNELPRGLDPQALIQASPATDLPLPRNSLDGVFTDPPYFDNVQYAELMDFCFAWLRVGLRHEFSEFAGTTTRTSRELTGNETLGRGLEHFTEGLSAVFQHYADALKPNAPFVFTYHHNDPAAYVPLVVAILDSRMTCTKTFPAAAEMTASLHIARTGSSVLDTIFVCRRTLRSRTEDRQTSLEFEVAASCRRALEADMRAMRDSEVRLTRGDLRCLLAGHLARIAVGRLGPSWDAAAPLRERMSLARRTLETLAVRCDVERLMRALGAAGTATRRDA